MAGMHLPGPLEQDRFDLLLKFDSTERSLCFELPDLR